MYHMILFCWIFLIQINFFSGSLLLFIFNYIASLCREHLSGQWIQQWIDWEGLWSQRSILICGDRQYINKVIDIKNSESNIVYEERQVVQPNIFEKHVLIPNGLFIESQKRVWGELKGTESKPYFMCFFLAMVSWLFLRKGNVRRMNRVDCTFLIDAKYSSGNSFQTLP